MDRPTQTLRTLALSLDEVLIEVVGEDSTPVTSVAYDSRRVEPGTLFFCVPGTKVDGHSFAPDAVASGASALLVERPLDLDVPQLVVTDARLGMARAAAAFYGSPAGRMVVVGVTGTNGKTTTAFMLDSIFRAEGRTTGLIGTIETRIAGRVKPGVRTTPESVDLQALFAEMADAGVDSVAMEVTSHALVLGRVEGVRFTSAGFTNLSQDHLDFHRDMEDYFEAKRSLFVPERSDAGAINADDPYGQRLIEDARIPLVSFGVTPVADVRALDVEMTPTRTSFTIKTAKGDVHVDTPLVGGFNVSNCLAAAAIAYQAGVGLEAIERGLNALEAVPGRFEPIDLGQPFTVVVDYAHTPDSLANVLRAARAAADRQGGRVLCVFGCGGDRDRGKRPVMGAVVARSADVVVVTSDNPRSEDPRAILDEILEGVVAHRREGPDAVLVDRAEAIHEAIGGAREGDVVVIAGKGHETGQEFASETIPFDDRIVAREALRSLGYGVSE